MFPPSCVALRDPPSSPSQLEQTWTSRRDCHWEVPLVADGPYVPCYQVRTPPLALSLVLPYSSSPTHSCRLPIMCLLLPG